MRDDAISAVAQLAALQHRAFTRRQAAAVGFDHRRIATAKRAGWLDEPLPGVLTFTGSPSTWHQRVMVAVLAGAGHAVASHRAAARLHRLDGFEHTGMAVVETSVQRSYRLDVPTSVVHHVAQLDRSDLTTVDGVACTTIPRTLADLGSVVRDHQLVGRALTSARRANVTPARIRATAERLHRPGQAGTGMILRLLDAIPSEGRVPDSWFEELLAGCLRDPELPEIVPQYAITDARGRVVARTDLGMPSIKLGLEAHSRRFHWGPRAGGLDEDRDIAAAGCGWELLYLGWHAAKRPGEVLRIVRDVVRARMCELSVRHPAPTTHR